ncbi:MAG TPA: OmpA family protein [Sulfuricaulis sp.]|nr:OmpA family protein [Sulfuricaulis sp.]
MELKPILLASLISGGCLVATPLSFAASDLMSSGYAHDNAGSVVRNNSGDCVRTSDWSPKSATTECDAHLLPPPVAEAPPQAEPAAPPAAEIAAIEPRPEPISIAEKAQFGFDQTALRAEDKQRLNEALVQIKNLPEDATIQITGYTDNVGSEEYNKDLSMRRAQAAQEYLVSNGVDQKRIVLSGMGESNPIASNDTADGRAMNRRVEVVAESK